ncbi:hypothetical protein F4680DRAFT_402906 [Xylaria scruposa]|nr:hypothetical protein F4680DRAFT_402906 [Xylaria scruposa]
MANLDDIPPGAPAAAPPPGVTPNLVDPVSKGPSLVVLGIFLSLSLLSVLIRGFVRLRLTRSWGWDDYACIAATIGTLTYAVFYIEVTTKAPPKHEWDIAISSFPGAIESLFISVNGLSYQITVFFARLSILLLYLRIFGVHKTFTRITIISIVIITLFYIAVIGLGIGFLAVCDDLTNLTESRFCLNYSGPVLLLNASFNVITDLWLLVLPFPLLVKLQMQPRQKLGLVAVFAAGVGACAASLARLIELAVNYGKPDFVWSQSIVPEFSIAEINIGIIVACVSTFPAFFGQMRNWLRPTGSSKYSQAKSSESDNGQTT